MKFKVFSVSEINQIISALCLTSPFFHRVRIKGETCNVKSSTNELHFFSLTDQQSKVNCIFFGEDFTLEDGQNIVIDGRCNYYQKNGSMRVIVNDFSIDGVSEQYQLFLDLKETLEKKGWFDKNKKKIIPKFPEKVGLVTSFHSDAFTDIISTSNQRFPLANFYVYDARVQGSQAVNYICKGIKKLDTMQLDLIIISRGGGSYDELSVFNNIEVIETIYQASTPIVTAIGHQNDFFLSDFVADLRCSTPTAVAHQIFPDIADYLEQKLNMIHQSKEKLCKQIKQLEDKIILQSVNIEHLILQKIQKEQFHLQQFNIKLLEQYQQIQTSYHLLNHQLETIYEKINNQHNKNCSKDYIRLFQLEHEIIKLDQIDEQENLQIIMADGIITSSILEIKWRKKIGSE